MNDIAGDLLIFDGLPCPNCDSGVLAEDEDRRSDVRYLFCPLCGYAEER